MKRFRRVLVALLTVALLLLQTTSAFAGPIKGGAPLPTPLSLPEDPGEPTP